MHLLHFLFGFGSRMDADQKDIFNREKNKIKYIYRLKNSNFLDLPGRMQSYIGVSFRLMQVPLLYWQALKNSLWLTDAQNIRNVFIH